MTASAEWSERSWPAGVPDQPWSAELISRLVTAGLDPHRLRDVLAVALAEDLRYGPDATTLATVPAGSTLTARIRCRAAGVLAGGLVVEALLAACLTGAEVTAARADGDRLAPADTVMTVTGDAREVLTVERTALNLACHLSGVATATRAWVDAVAGTGCRIRDTRKTLPGLRELQKYAVRCGGGVNHRMALGDAVLIKDNHVAVAGSITAALAAVRARAGNLPIEVEVDRLDQLDEAIEAGADLVLLDNWTPEQCAEGVRRARAAVRADGGKVTRLEASGGLTLGVARGYAETGVDFLAVGALTHSVIALDLGLDL